MVIEELSPENKAELFRVVMIVESTKFGNTDGSSEKKQRVSRILT